MVIMFAGFVLLYESPTGQAIIEITPAVERKLSTTMKYHLTPGKTYLIEEEKQEKSYDIFMDAVLHGIRGLIVTRTKPDSVQQKFELRVTPVLWLTHVQAQMTTVDPSELEQFVFLVEKFVNTAKEQAVTEGEAPVVSLPEEEPKMKEEIIEKQVVKSVEKKPREIPKEEKFIEAKVVFPEQKPEEVWKMKMKETLAEVKETAKKSIVIGEESAERPLKELVKEAEKAGAAVVIEAKPANKGVMLVLEEEPGETREEKKRQEETKNKDVEKEGANDEVKEAETKGEEVSLKEIEKKEEIKSAEPKADVAGEKNEEKAEEKKKSGAPEKEKKSSNELAEKPLKELVREAEKLDGVEIKGKPSGGGIEIKKGKFLILGEDEETKDEKTKTSFILAAGDVPSGIGLNKSIILIDGLEYLVSNNTFTAVLHLLQTLKDKISLGESMLIIPVNPKCFNEKEISMLRMEFETYVEEVT